MVLTTSSNTFNNSVLYKFYHVCLFMSTYFFSKKICYEKIFYIKTTKKLREKANFLPAPSTVQLYVINCTTLCYQLYNSMLSTVQLYVINCTTLCYQLYNTLLCRSKKSHGWWLFRPP